MLVEYGFSHVDNVTENKLDQNVAFNLGLSKTRKPFLHFFAIVDLNSKRTVWRAWTKIFYSIAAKPSMGLFNVPQCQITKDNIQSDDLFSLILLVVQCYHMQKRDSYKTVVAISHGFSISNRLSWWFYYDVLYSVKGVPLDQSILWHSWRNRLKQKLRRGPVSEGHWSCTIASQHTRKCS